MSHISITYASWSSCRSNMMMLF